MYENENKGRRKWIIILILGIIGFGVSIGFVGWYLMQRNAENEAMENLREEVIIESVPEPVVTAAPEADNFEEPEFTGEREGEAAVVPEGIVDSVNHRIDFAALKGINSELYAWIYIPDTPIDYPVAQHMDPNDQKYYLNYDFYGGGRYAGCIFSEYGTAKDFSDPMTILYGHNMLDDSMFGSLHYFSDPDFFEQHPYFMVFTEDKLYVYNVFAAYHYDNRHLNNSFDFNNATVFSQYLEAIRNLHTSVKNIREEAYASAEDKVLTLSTCIGGQPQYRMLVAARLAFSGGYDESEEAERVIIELTTGQ